MSADQVWHGVVATAVLVVSAYFAWRSARSSAIIFSSQRAIRILAPIFLFSATIAILLVPELWQAGSPVGPLMSVLLALLLAIPNLVLTLLLEVAAWRMRASRTRGWLAAAALLFGLGLAACLVLPTALYTGKADILDWEVAEILAISLSSGLVWWSLLPTRRIEMTEVFN